jgi:hypothetical protein
MMLKIKFLGLKNGDRIQYFGGDEFSPIFKADSNRALGPLQTLEVTGRVVGRKF